MSPSRPCIIGRPGRTATFQNDSVEPLGGERLLDEVVVADRGAACRHQHVGGGVARTSHGRDRLVEPIRDKAEVDYLAPCACARAGGANPLE